MNYLSFYEMLQSNLEEKCFEKTNFNCTYDFYLDVIDEDFDKITLVKENKFNYIMISNDMECVYLDDLKYNNRITITEDARIVKYLFGNPVKNIYTETYYFIREGNEKKVLLCEYA